MWRHHGTLHWSCSSMPTVYGNSHSSGIKTHNTVNTGQYSQLRMNEWLSSMWWKYWGHFDIGPFGCRRGIQSHCITISQCTMTYSISWMEWCELWPRRWLNEMKTCSSLWSELDRIFPNTMLKWLQWLAWFSCPHTFSILSGSCDGLASGTTEWIVILRTRHPKLHNSLRPFWSMWRMNTVPIIDVCRSIHSKPNRVAISPALQQLQGPINHSLIHMICPAIMRDI
jgi:hypothetical protein